MRCRLTRAVFRAADTALTLRRLLESMSYNVPFLRVATPADIPRAHKHASDADMIVLNAQGGAATVYLGHFAGKDHMWLPLYAVFDGASFRDKAGGHSSAPLGPANCAAIVPRIGVCLLGAQKNVVDTANAVVGPVDQFVYG